MKIRNVRAVLYIAGVFAVVLLLVFSSQLIGLYTEYLWFQSVDYTEVFETRIVTRIWIAVVSTLLTLALLILNWSLIPYWFFPEGDLQAQIRGTKVTISTRPLRLLFTLAALLVGIPFGISMGQHWRTFLLAREGLPFGLDDPIFGMDLGFYVFEVPWYDVLLDTASGLVVIIALGLFLRYALFGQIRKREAIAHLSTLGALWLLLLSASQWIQRYALLDSGLGVVSGAGYTDVNARMPVLVIKAVIFVVAAVILIVNAFARRGKLLLLVGLAWVVVSVLGALFPAAVQQFQVEPNEFVLERPYIEHNIQFTRHAYNLDDIDEDDYPATGSITPQELEAYEDVLRNVRLWDYRPLLRTYSQLQEIRLYYHFQDVDIDRYIIDGELREVMLSARELDVDQLADQAETWINRHLIFTHGYGVTLSPVGEVTPQGLPRLLVRDIPPVAEDPALALTRPEIYFGESTHNYVLVDTTEDEFDYPQGDANVYTRYEAPTGVRLGGFFRRALLALRLNSSQILISPALTDDSRVLFHRTLTDRTNTIAPMLWYDSDPYPVIAEGRIVWMLDAYTWTNRYPYSEPMGEVNYMRNSVKVTIDAYTGEVTYYLVDPEEPIAATYARIFPELFKPAEEMSAALREHWRYPETLFLYQSQLYATYHMRDPQVFYNREDVWDIPQELVQTEQQVMEPYYVILRLPDAESAEFMLIRPYVPKEKQNMVAWLYADSDGEDYGELGVFKLAKDRLIYGPLQIEGRINQDPVISQQLSLWDQRGSRVLRGNLLVIPLNDSFLYIEPLYLESESGQLPELKRVLVAYEDRVAMAPTLSEALMQVITGEDTEPPADGEAPTGNLESLAQQAWERYQAGQACLEAGDWTCYGREQVALEEILRAMVGE